jgi:hypothetical protein
MNDIELIRKNDLLQRELTKLVRLDGSLRPEDILDAAKSAAHPLHSCFVWDDTEAAARYRLLQAKALVRYVRIIIPTPEHRTIIVRMFASLPSDRFSGAGYRTLSSVLSDEEKKRELVISALRELEAFQRRYANLQELAGVMGEITRLTRNLEKAARTKKPRKRRPKRKGLKPPPKIRKPKGPGRGAPKH